MNRRFVLKVLGVLCATAVLIAGYWILNPSVPPDLVIEGLHPAIHVPGMARPDGEPNCNKVVRCGNLVAVSCRPELDGPLDYYDNTDGKLLMHCGGLSHGGPCPPHVWTCAPP